MSTSQLNITARSGSGSTSVNESRRKRMAWHALPVHDDGRKALLSTKSSRSVGPIVQGKIPLDALAMASGGAKPTSIWMPATLEPLVSSTTLTSTRSPGLPLAVPTWRTTALGFGVGVGVDSGVGVIVGVTLIVGV